MFTAVVSSLRQRGNEVITERDDAREKLKAVRTEKSQLSSELQSVKAESKLYSEVYAMLERIAPDVLRQAKEMVQAEKLAEQQRQAEYQPTVFFWQLIASLVKTQFSTSIKSRSFGTAVISLLLSSTRICPSTIPA